MRERFVIGWSKRWVVFLAVSGAGLVILMLSTSKAQVDAPKVSLSALAADQAQSTARALVVKLTEQVRSQRSQLQQTEASLAQARTLLRILGGPLPGEPSPFEDEDHRLKKLLTAPSRSLPPPKP